jgi:hypothetical protein
VRGRQNQSIFVLPPTLIVSCGEDEPKPKTPEELLQGATRGWIVTAATISPPLPAPGGGTTTNLFPLLDACERDEVTTFRNATQYRIENIQKCEPDEPTIWEDGTWTLSTDKRTLRFSPTGDSPYEVQILELTEATFRLSETENILGTMYTFTITMEPRR